MVVMDAAVACWLGMMPDRSPWVHPVVLRTFATRYTPVTGCNRATGCFGLAPLAPVTAISPSVSRGTCQCAFWSRIYPRVRARVWARVLARISGDGGSRPSPTTGIPGVYTRSTTGGVTNGN